MNLCNQTKPVEQNTHVSKREKAFERTAHAQYRYDCTERSIKTIIHKKKLIVNCCNMS